jgi:hypothetical protein
VVPEKLTDDHIPLVPENISDQEKLLLSDSILVRER